MRPSLRPSGLDAHGVVRAYSATSKFGTKPANNIPDYFRKLRFLAPLPRRVSIGWSLSPPSRRVPSQPKARHDEIACGNSDWIPCARAIITTDSAYRA